MDTTMKTIANFGLLIGLIFCIVAQFNPGEMDIPTMLRGMLIILLAIYIRVQVK